MSDKAEILSEAEVDFLLSAEKPDPAPPPAPAGPEDQAVTMRGDLEQINLADIFQTLAMSKMEGVLRIRNPLEERQVYCRDGYLRVLVPARLATRRLGQRLVRAGLVTAEQLRTALLEQRRDKRPIGQLLVAGGYVGQEAVDEIVAMQVAEDLFALFTWRHGTFEFWKGEPAPEVRDAFASCPDYEVNSLLLEVARRSDEWESILSTLGSLDEIPCRLHDVAEGKQFDDLHREVLQSVDGQSTFREIADRTTHGLFDVARAARDLARAELVAQVDEPTMVAIAKNDAEIGQSKRALVLLQTLRDRPGDRPMGILQTMADALAKAGERRLAGSLLIEAAQRHTDATTALDLARTARGLAPHDVGTLSFLRTVLVAHAPPDSPELEKCTLDLLDALIEADLVPTAIEIIEDARRTNTVRPAILMREVRARQRARDLPGATAALEELAQLHDQQGEAQQALEAYDMLVRLDRSRKDVQKLLAQRRRTRVGQLVRLVAALTILTMVAGMGIVFWQEHQRAKTLAAADQDISSLLAAGNRAEARDRLDFWAAELGACEMVEDLRNRISFADAAELGRLQKLLRSRINAELAAAAERLERGALAEALAIYGKLAEEPKARAEVVDVVEARLDALLSEIAQAAKGLQARMPPNPETLIDRQNLLNGQADLHSIARPALLTLFEQLDALSRAEKLPPFLREERRARIDKTLAEGRTVFTRASRLAAGYGEALARNDQQRQLDPLFKAAVERERAFDFATALSHYRELERQQANDGNLRAHFRDRVARNATIVRLLEALRSATATGDFATAQQQLRALRVSFPEVPFDRIAQVPLRIDSRPSGARVVCNGVDVGKTPLLLARAPADSLRLAVEADGFARTETTVTGDEPGGWTAFLALPPERSWNYGSALEMAPASTKAGTVAVDRAGDVTLRNEAGESRWRFRSGDLSGLLTPPRVRDSEVYVGSIDGELRALDLASGELLWSLPDMPTEVAPLLVGDVLLVATTDRRLHCVQVAQRARVTLDLPEPPAALVHLRGAVAGVLGSNGHLLAVDLGSRKVLWERNLAARSAPQACLAQGTLVVVDDRGHAVGVDSANGQVLWQRDLEGEVLGAPVPAETGVWITARAQVHHLDAASGQVRTSVAPDEHEWTGPATRFGSRLVVPMRGGLQVCDLASGERLYRLPAGKRSRVHVVGSELWVAEHDHTVNAYSRLR